MLNRLLQADLAVGECPCFDCGAISKSGQIVYCRAWSSLSTKMFQTVCRRCGEAEVDRREVLARELRALAPDEPFRGLLEASSKVERQLDEQAAQARTPIHAREIGSRILDVLRKVIGTGSADKAHPDVL